jgi:hypothetical protein
VPEHRSKQKAAPYADRRGPEIGNAETPEEPFAIGERGIEDGRGETVALGRHGLVGSLSPGRHPVKYRWLGSVIANRHH